MRKQIPIEQLRVGMYVIGLDRSWIKTPFWRHRMQVESLDHIEALRACGVRSVEIDTEKGLDLASQSGSVSTVDPSSARIVDLSSSRASLPQGKEPSTPFEEELSVAKEVYKQAKVVIGQAMGDAREGRGLDIEAVSKVSEGLLESVLRNTEALSSLSRLKSFDEYTFFHSVNVAILALAMGRHLGMPREALSKLGLGALLHDIGKMKIPYDLLNAPRRLEAGEREIINQHVMRGAEYLSQHAVLPEETLRPLLEHHERVDGSGYPAGRRRKDLSQFGLIASIVDVYDAITTDRVYHAGVPPHQALRQVYGLGLEGHLDLDAVRGLIQCLGRYPVGSCVRLSTGEIGVVSRPNLADPSKPALLLVMDGSTPCQPPKPFDLAEQPTRPARSIVATVDPRGIGIDPNHVLGSLAA